MLGACTGTPHERQNPTFLRSLAHVELNAIDLAWDTVVRFSRYGLPAAFYADFARWGNAWPLVVGGCCSTQGTWL